jgi:hypothetical protein
MDAEPGSPHKLNEQPISVDFIDNHAHEYDAAFANLQTRYDQRLGKYQPEAHYDKQVISHSLQYGHYPRPQPAALNELEFWEQIFPLAMDSFKAAHPEEPKGRSESAYSIRRLDNWAAVYKILQDAQTANESPSGIRGSVKKGFRRVMKHTQPLEQILSVVPEIDYISPVTGTLGIIIKVRSISLVRYST